MESEFNQFDRYPAKEMLFDLRCSFGVDGAEDLISLIRSDHPYMNSDQVIKFAWSFIPEATAYMMHADSQDLATNAVLLYLDYLNSGEV